MWSDRKKYSQTNAAERALNCSECPDWKKKIHRGKIKNKTARTMLIRDVSGAGSGLLLCYCVHFRDNCQARTGVDVEISLSFLSLNWPREVLGNGSWSANCTEGSQAPAGMLSAAVFIIGQIAGNAIQNERENRNLSWKTGWYFFTSDKLVHFPASDRAESSGAVRTDCCWLCILPHCRLTGNLARNVEPHNCALDRLPRVPTS